MNIRKCFFKPENEQVKLEIGIDMSSGNIDEYKAQSIAKEINSAAQNKEKDIFENDIMDKIEYISRRNLKDCSNYAVGVFNGRELHVTSLKGKNIDCICSCFNCLLN